jgi:hypothetical protein
MNTIRCPIGRNGTVQGDVTVKKVISGIDRIAYFHKRIGRSFPYEHSVPRNPIVPFQGRGTNIGPYRTGGDRIEPGVVDIYSGILVPYPCKTIEGGDQFTA